MKCEKCGHNLPADSRFCQYCGSSISENTTSQSVQDDAETSTAPVQPVRLNLSAVGEPQRTYGNYHVSGSDVAFVPENQHKVAQPASQQTPPTKTIPLVATQKAEECLSIEKPKKSENKALLIVLAIISLISVPLNVVQQINVQEKTETVSTQAKEIGELKKEVSSQEATLKNLRNKVSNLEDDADAFEDIISGARKGNIGYANRYFHISDGVVVLNKYSTKQLTLITSWSGYHTVSMKSSSSVANVTFDKDNWGSSTTLTVTPNRPGVAVVEFSSTRDSDTFNVIIIVTD